MLELDSLTDDRCRRHAWWVLLAITALLYLPGLGTLPMMDRDEPRFGHATVEMMQRGAWVVPYFNSDPAMSDQQRIDAMRKGKGAMEVGYRFDKPPLTYWWMRLYYNLLGINPFAARLHAVTATWLVSLVIFGMGSRLARPSIGLIGGITWLTTLQVIVHGRLCVADMPMVLFVALSCWAVMELLLRDARLTTPNSNALPGAEAEDSSSRSPLPTFSLWHWMLYASLGLGFLAKGPIAWLVPGLALALYRLAFWRKPVAWDSLRVWPGALITLGITGAWGIPALIETQGLFWKVGMGEHVIDRGASSFNGRFPIPGYYLFSSLLSLFPWIALLPQVWRQVRSNWTPQAAFLVSWLASPYLIFSFYATQLPHYVMPAFPAAMLLLAVWGPSDDTPKWMRAWTHSILGLFLLVGIALKALGSFAGFPAPLAMMVKDLGSLLTILGMAIPMCGMVIMSLSPSVETKEQPYSRGGAIIAAFLLLVGVPFSLFMATRDLNKTQPAVQLAEQIGPLPDKTEYIGWQFQEPSLVFHFNHHWKFFNKLDTIRERLDRKGPRVCVLLRREWTMSKAIAEKRAGKDEVTTAQDFSTEVDAVIAAHPDYQLFSFSGLNAARSSWTELRVLVRK